MRLLDVTSNSATIGATLPASRFDPMELDLTVALRINTEAVTIWLKLCSTIFISVYVITNFVEADLSTGSLKLSPGTLSCDINL